MPLTPNQPRTGHLDEDSKNTEPRGGRDDGFHANQATSGHKSEADLPTGPNQEERGGRPFVATNRGEDLPNLPPKEVRRTDTAREVQ